MATQFDHSKAFAKFRIKAKQHAIGWPSQRAFDQATQYVRPGTDRHLVAALLLSGHKVTMEQVEAITGSAQYNVVRLLHLAKCRPVTGTDKDGHRLYGFTPAKALDPKKPRRILGQRPRVAS
jgi:hypothetical protein